MKKYNIIILAILPILLVYIGFYLRPDIPYYFLSCCDPEYQYLLNGLSISKFYAPGTAQGPGTPLHVLFGVVIRIVHLFRHQDTLLVDVFKNPELYLTAVNATLIVIEGIILFFVGLIIYKTSQKIVVGVFFQLMPLSAWLFLDLLRRMTVENLVIMGIMCLIIVVYKYINSDEDKSKLIDKYTIWFSVFTGFIMAAKLMYAPILILPFLLSPGYKKKGVFTVLTIISFLFFAFTIFFNWVPFYRWYLDNFLHTGQYGAGTSSIIDIKYYASNLKLILGNKSIFSLAFFIILIGSCIYHLPFLKVKQKNDKFYKALLGVSLVMIIMILLVAKQFKYYYLTSALLLVIPGLYLILTIYSRPIKKINRNIYLIPALFIFIFYIYKKELGIIFLYHQIGITQIEPYVRSMHYIENKYDKNKPTLVLASYYGAPYKQYGLYFGYGSCSGKMVSNSASVLKELYPHIYFYHGWNNLFNQWGSSYSFIDLLKKYQNINFFSGDPEAEKSLNSKFHGINRQIDTKYKRIFYNDTTKEKIYEVTYDSIAANKIKLYDCNAELVDSTGNFFMNNYGQKFEFGTTQTSEKSKSGHYSSKLTKERPYGMTCTLSEVKMNEHYSISIWRYNNNPNAGLVISAYDTKIYYNFQVTSEKEQNKWQKLRFELIVPEYLNNKDILIYTWNSDDILPAYFDDLTIEKL